MSVIHDRNAEMVQVTIGDALDKRLISMERRLGLNIFYASQDMIKGSGRAKAMFRPLLSKCRLITAHDVEVIGLTLVKSNFGCGIILS